MSNNLLYFPYISIPESSWTTKSILYWDTVGTIVPHQFINDPNRLDNYMKALVERELVTQVFPYNYIYKAEHFDDSFLKLIRQRNFNLDERRRAFSRGENFRIHVQKFGDTLLQELILMGIAKRQDYEWYSLEARTAKLFMVYLASVISRIGDFTPATNSAANIDFSVQQNGYSHRTLKLRGKFLEDLLPYPIESDPDKLQKFKEKHSVRLRKFRNRLEQAIVDISNLRNSPEAAEMYRLKLEEIVSEKNEIINELDKSRFGKITFGSLFRLVGSISAFAADQRALGLFTLGNAIYTAVSGYNRPELKRDIAYLALIDRSFSTYNRQ
jgi:hypothetical protein